MLFWGVTGCYLGRQVAFSGLWIIKDQGMGLGLKQLRLLLGLLGQLLGQTQFLSQETTDSTSNSKVF